MLKIINVVKNKTKHFRFRKKRFSLKSLVSFNIQSVLTKSFNCYEKPISLCWLGNLLNTPSHKILRRILWLIVFTIVSASYDVLEKQKCMFIFCDQNNPNFDSEWEAHIQSTFGRVVIHCGCSRDFEGECGKRYGCKKNTEYWIWIDCNHIVKAVEARFRNVHLLFQISHSY